MEFLTPLEAFNTAIDVASAVFMLLLCIILFVRKKYTQNSVSDILIMLVVSFTISCISDAGTWALLNVSDDSVIFEIFLIFDYDFFCITIALIHLYLVENLGDRVKFSMYFSHFALVVCAVEGILWATSKWTGLFYIIDDAGYVHSKYFIWSQIPEIIIMLVDYATVVFNWNKIRINERVAWSCYIVLGLAVEIIGMFTNIPWLYLGMAIILLVMHLEIDVYNSIIINKQRAELVEARSKLVVSQIKPHFIYNCLAVIQVLCRKDPDLASETVKRFSNFLRGTMDSVDKKELVTFEEEMYIVNNYIFIEKVRFQDKLNVEKEIEIEDFLIPQLTIQPLVENAIKHGIRGRVEGGTVTIHSYETDKENIVEVSDDGVGFDLGKVGDDGRNHIGMKSVRDRLKLMCNGRLEIISEIGKGTKVIVHIPK